MAIKNNTVTIKKNTVMIFPSWFFGVNSLIPNILENAIQDFSGKHATSEQIVNCLITLIAEWTDLRVGQPTPP